MIGLSGEWLKVKRSDPSKYMTQGEVARALGVTQASVCRWESGMRLIPLTRVNDLARVFRMSRKRLLEEALEEHLD